MAPSMRRGLPLVLALILAACNRRATGPSALPAQAELKSLHLNNDLKAELFVHEPEVMSPVEMVFDENGRIYVAEMLDYPTDPPQGKPARSRIRLLEDTNGDGKIDHTTVFAENVLDVSGLMAWKGGLIVTSA